jgi:hypothetical protein
MSEAAAELPAFDAAAFLTVLVLENGYKAPRVLSGGRYACLAPQAYTVAIITGRLGDFCSIEDRWCYHTEQAARRALDAWDGEGEPEGWHRAPYSGRRRAQTEDEHDQDGNRVPIGTVYVRW